MHQYKKVTLNYLNTAPKKMQFDMELPVSCSDLFHIFEGTDTWTWAGIEDVIWEGEPPYNSESRRRIIQGRNRLDEQFLVWEQDRHMTFRIEQGDVGIFGALMEDYVVVPLGENACRFTWTIAFEFKGWFRLLSPLLGFVVHNAFKGYVKNFQKFVARR